MTGPEHLKDWRKRRGFNLTEAAEYLGVGVPYLSNVESGRKRVGLDVALRLRDLACIPVDVWAYSPDSPPAPRRRKTDNPSVSNGTTDARVD
jgi:transcriptional regulator with XRE-family HTH domain